jgi:hypothetical protein
VRGKQRPQDWVNRPLLEQILTLHDNKQVRQLAIDTYGSRVKGGFPFNPNEDTLRTRIGRYRLCYYDDTSKAIQTCYRDYHKASDNSQWTTSKHRITSTPELLATVTFHEVDIFFVEWPAENNDSFQATVPDFTYHNTHDVPPDLCARFHRVAVQFDTLPNRRGRPTRQDADDELLENWCQLGDLLARLMLDPGSTVGFDAKCPFFWLLWQTLHSGLPNLKHLAVETTGTDDCLVRGGLNDDGGAADDGVMVDDHDFWSLVRMAVLDGLEMLSKDGRTVPFPKLRTLTVEKKGWECSATVLTEVDFFGILKKGVRPSVKELNESLELAREVAEDHDAGAAGEGIDVV